jgi:hypothetical protein
VNDTESSFLTSKKTPRSSVTEISWLVLFREIIGVYYENYMKPINKVCVCGNLRVTGVIDCYLR